MRLALSIRFTVFADIFIKQFRFNYRVFFPIRLDMRLPNNSLKVQQRILGKHNME